MYCRLGPRSSFESIRYPSFIVFHWTCLREYSAQSHIGIRQRKVIRNCTNECRRGFSKYRTFLEKYLFVVFLCSCAIRREEWFVERLMTKLEPVLICNFRENQSARYVLTRSFIFNCMPRVRLIKWLENAIRNRFYLAKLSLSTVIIGYFSKNSKEKHCKRLIIFLIYLTNFKYLRDVSSKISLRQGPRVEMEQEILLSYIPLLIPFFHDRFLDHSPPPSPPSPNMIPA